MALNKPAIQIALYIISAEAEFKTFIFNYNCSIILSTVYQNEHWLSGAIHWKYVGHGAYCAIFENDMYILVPVDSSSVSYRGCFRKFALERIRT